MVRQLAKDLQKTRRGRRGESPPSRGEISRVLSRQRGAPGSSWAAVITGFWLPLPAVTDFPRGDEYRCQRYPFLDLTQALRSLSRLSWVSHRSPSPNLRGVRGYRYWRYTSPLYRRPGTAPSGTRFTPMPTR